MGYIAYRVQEHIYYILPYKKMLVIYCLLVYAPPNGLGYRYVTPVFL